MSNRHICFVDSLRTWGGAEVWVLDTAKQLLEQGHRCSIVAQPGSQLLERAKKDGVPCVGIPIRFDAAPWTLAQLARYFKREKVSAIIANLTKDLKAASVAGRLAGVEVILSSRESDFPLKKKLYYRWYFNAMATGVLVNSQATRKTVMQSTPWLDAARVHLLYKGIDTERFKPTPIPHQPAVGFVGQLIERKGIFDLMAAWEILEKQSWIQNPQLLLAGEGVLEKEILAWKTTLAHPEQVNLVGFQEDIENFYQNISVLAMPSLAEGFGLAAAEAASSTVPVVATNTSSLPEIVLHEKTGILVPAKDPQKLAHAMTQLLKNESRAAELGAAGREHILTNFSLQKTLDKLLQLTERKC